MPPATTRRTTSTTTVSDDPPTAVDDSVTARSGSTVIIPVTGNDYDPDGDAIAVSAVGTLKKAGNGTTDVLSATSVAYVPNPGFSGTDSFDYTIVDENGGTDTATVNVQLFPPGTPNQPPIARTDHVKTGTGPGRSRSTCWRTTSTRSATS